MLKIFLNYQLWLHLYNMYFLVKNNVIFSIIHVKVNNIQSLAAKPNLKSLNLQYNFLQHYFHRYQSCINVCKHHTRYWYRLQSTQLADKHKLGSANVCGMYSLVKWLAMIQQAVSLLPRLLHQFQIYLSDALIARASRAFLHFLLVGKRTILSQLSLCIFRDIPNTAESGEP